MTRPSHAVATLALLAAAAPALASPERSTGQAAVAVERSTGQVAVAVETLPIVESRTLAFANGADRAVFEGTISRRGPVEVVLSPVPAGMLDVGVAARSGTVWMSVFHDDSDRPAPGTAAAGRTVRWISGADGAKRLRIVVYSGGDETPFRVLLRVTQPATGD